MKDDSLPYVYLDEDEDEAKKKKARKKAADRDELPYTYVDEDETPKKTRARRSADELPYTYIDEEEAPRKKAAARKSDSRADGRRGASSPKARPASAGSGNGAAARKRAPAKKKKKKSGTGMIALLTAMLLLVACAVVFLLDMTGTLHIGLWDKISGKSVSTTSTPKPDSTFRAAWFSSDGNEDGDLNQSEAGSAKVSPDKLNINPNLPDEWQNILLLGTDSRVSYEPSRTDTMMICSINKRTGQVKLTSIMRDTAVELEIEGKTREVKINTAYFYGGRYGAELAMATVNKYFDLNIDTYVVVNFSGFAKIAQALGGVDMNVTTAELEYLNHNVAEQYYLLYTSGEMGYEEAQSAYYATKLESGGEKTHLDGMQTLGYARIRKIDSEYARTERQRNVLNALLTKMHGADAATIIGLANANYQYVYTNMTLSDIMVLANSVLGSREFTGLTPFRVPVQGSYKEETRNNVFMFYDVNMEQNVRELHNFIYGN